MNDVDAKLYATNVDLAFTSFDGTYIFPAGTRVRIIEDGYRAGHVCVKTEDGYSGWCEVYELYLPASLSGPKGNTLVNDIDTVNAIRDEHKCPFCNEELRPSSYSAVKWIDGGYGRLSLRYLCDCGERWTMVYKLDWIEAN